nr:zinc finger, CCHC-type [Tanacetum cinerariifolium]
MTGAKFDIKKFDGTGDFGLWRIKMRALLIQHGCEAALEVLPADMEAQTKAELNKKAHSAVILCLGNKVLREVTGKTTASGGLVKARNFVHDKVIGQQVLPEKEVVYILHAEMSKAKGADGERLYVRGRTDHRDSRQSRRKSRSKSRGGRLKCYIFQSEDHLKRNCPKNNRKKSTGYVTKDEQPSSSGSTYDDSKLGDNRECKIKGIGMVRVQLKDRSSFVLHNVRYILELKRNLISLGTLEKRGELNVSIEEKDNLAQVWHKRLGHISEAGLQVLEKHELFGKKSL